MATSPLTQRIIYSDLFTNLDIHPVRKTVLRKTNVDAVKQSIRNLLLTDRGERPFNLTLVVTFVLCYLRVLPLRHSILPSST